MRIDAVRAAAFGPFAGETLELAPRMNVIFGPNESGKSSWHAAIYAGLCGMKKSRGQPTRDDRDFANRHRPWRGTTWRVTAVVTLDDGRTIEIDQEFGPRGRSVATDSDTKRPLTGDMLRAGSVDGTTLLGLTRETAIATLFVRQADMLRVLNDAGALQEYLERAAATSTADTTAEETLARIAAYRKNHVGVLREGSRGPLASAKRRLQEAQEQLDEAEGRFESYQELIGQRHTAETDVRQVERQLAEVAEHERERLRRQRWADIRSMERRLDQARQLTQQLATWDGEAVDKQLVASVNRALAEFDNRPAEPSPMDGPTSGEIEAELAALPEMPAGDLEPSPRVVVPFDQWRNEQQRLAAHEEIEPSARPRAAPVPPPELRRLAEELDVPVPAVDSTLIDEIERRRSIGVPPLVRTSTPATSREPRTRGKPTVLSAVGAVLAITGVLLVALAQPIIGAAALLVGASVAVAGALMGRRAGTTRPLSESQQGGVPASPFGSDSDLPRLEARLALQQEAQALAERRRDSAAARIVELDLPADPGELRRLAAEGDVTAGADARRSEWQRRRQELQIAEAFAADALREALSARGFSLEGNDLSREFASYAKQCRERAEVARKAVRRADLDAQLASRRAAEAAREHERAARAAAELQLFNVGEEAECLADPIEELAEALRRWIETQEEAAATHQRHEKTAARLDQLLDGSTLKDLEGEFATMMSKGDEAPPDVDARPLEDHSADLNALQLRARKRRETLAELGGQIEGADRHLKDVSVAIETESRAAAEVSRLVVLSEDLDLASEILEAAKQKVHADIAPILNDTLRPWVPRITGGGYDDIRVNPATLEVEAHEAGGQFRLATVLSHGTTEQLFLLLRLALAQRLTTTGETAPVILDDITVQSDSNRTLATLDLLHELSNEHQIVLFSQEDQVLHWAEEHLHDPTDRLTRLPASV